MTKQQYQDGYDRFHDKLEMMSMGRLVGQLKERSDLPLNLGVDLDKCADARATLAHRYFWTRAGEFSLPEGQIEMINECDSFLQLFEEVDSRVDKYLALHCESLALSGNDFSEAMELIIRTAENKLRNRHAEPE